MNYRNFWSHVINLSEEMQSKLFDEMGEKIGLRPCECSS